jgi:N,N-dimethylformamidase
VTSIPARSMIEHVGTGRFTIPGRVDGSRYDLVAEFMRAPLARHSESLQLMLARMRSDTSVGRLVLLRERSGRLILAEPPSARGAPWREIADVATSADAERLAFALRFESHTGMSLPAPAHPGHRAPSTPPPVNQTRKLAGYAVPLSVAPGSAVSCHLSAAQAGQADVDVVRMRSGDGSPAGPGLHYDLLATQANGRYDVAPQEVRPGSFATASLGPLSAGTVSLQVTFCPTLPVHKPQSLVSLDGITLMLTASGRPGLEAGAGSEITSCVVDLPCRPWHWYTLVGTCSGEGLSCRLYAAPSGTELASAQASHSGLAALSFGGQVMLAARPRAGHAADHFNGRLEQPAIVTGLLTDAEVTSLAEPGQSLSTLPAGLAQRVVAWWDFSQQAESWSVLDRGPRGAAASLMNLPRRAVTGSRWDGVTRAWPDAPEQFAAAHFLRDSLEDCGWPATVCWQVPPYLRPGCYAFRVRGCGDEELVPFFVRRDPGAKPARKVLVLIPTATYLSYGNSRFWWEDPIQEAVSDRLVELGPEDMYVMAHPELGPSAYDVHEDGTDVTHVSHRRPNLFMRTTNRHFEGYVSDLYLIGWLEHVGADYEVATDEDLDVLGGSLLDGVQVVVTGTHPEYVTDREYDALAAFQERGGRLMYLGGNGFQSRVAFSLERPWIMENRRTPYWKSAHPGAQAEHLLASDGQPGGHLAGSGRPAMSLVGVESVTMGFDESVPFHRARTLPGRAKFVFEGVTGSEIGDFGLIGGAVVGQEWDNASSGDPLPDGHIILASSRDHSMIPPLFGAVREPYHADMVLIARSSGGACFSVGTMAWCGALPHNGYHNEVARITENVLRRFLDPQPL